MAYSLRTAVSASVCTCLRSRTLGSPALLTRSMHAPATAPARIPQPRGSTTTPESLLAQAGRNMSQYTSKLGGDELTWQALFTKTGQQLADAGMTPKERRYLLWVLEKYRQGFDVKAIALPLKPKKKIRGWGPKVQLGKRIR